MPTRKMPFIPPGGFAGFAQQTPAVQALVSRPGTRRKRKKVTRKKAATRRRSTRARPTRSRRKPAVRRKRAGKKPAHMVKGSLAAKRHMAKLRRMRKK